MAPVPALSALERSASWRIWTRKNEEEEGRIWNSWALLRRNPLDRRHPKEVTFHVKTVTKKTKEEEKEE